MIQAFATSDIGKVRPLNEDSFFISQPEDEVKLFIVADGMGGYKGGEIASSLAVKSAKNYILSNFEKNKGDKENLQSLVKSSSQYANMVVFEKSKEDEELRNMGTTLDVCLIYENKAFISHIGDSRIYRIRKEFMRKLTKDHSYVQQLVDEGKITKEESMNHPKKNMLIKVENPHIRDYYAEAAAEIFNLKKENVYEELEQNRYKKNAALNKNNNNSLYLCEMDFIACLSRLPIDTIDDLLSDFNLDMINDNEIKNILKIMLANLLKISDIKQITHELGDQFVELAMREIAGDDAYKEALKNKKQIELNYLKKRQNELIEQMRTTSDKSLQISMLQELNSLTKQIAGKK